MQSLPLLQNNHIFNPYCWIGWLSMLEHIKRSTCKKKKMTNALRLTYCDTKKTNPLFWLKQIEEDHGTTLIQSDCGSIAKMRKNRKNDEKSQKWSKIRKNQQNDKMQKMRKNLKNAEKTEKWWKIRKMLKNDQKWSNLQNIENVENIENHRKYRKSQI